VGCGCFLIGGNPTGRVDLNPIRAAIAETPETSEYTRAKDRIDDLNEREDRTRPSTHDWESSRRRRKSVSMARYLELLDWTGRQLKADKVGVIPDHLAPILTRIGLDATGWCDVVSKFGRVFKRAAGTPESLAREVLRCGQHWLCAPDNPLG